MYLIFDTKPNQEFSDCVFDYDKDRVKDFGIITPARVIMEMAQENNDIDTVILLIQKGLFNTDVLIDIVPPYIIEEQKYTALVVGSEHSFLCDILIYDMDGIKKAFDYNECVYKRN